MSPEDQLDRVLKAALVTLRNLYYSEENIPQSLRARTLKTIHLIESKLGMELTR